MNPTHAWHVTRKHAARPLRFGIVGAVTFGLQYLLLSLLTSSGVTPAVAYLIALAVAVQFNFIVSQLLVWHDRPMSLTVGRVANRWATFHAMIAVSLVVNFIAFVLLEPYLGNLGASLGAIVFSTIIKFFSLDRVVFKPTRAA
jgi:putative flippase GtrA